MYLLTTVTSVPNTVDVCKIIQWAVKEMREAGRGREREKEKESGIADRVSGCKWML